VDTLEMRLAPVRKEETSSSSSDLLAIRQLMPGLGETAAGSVKDPDAVWLGRLGDAK
jgi:hypothetical protein